MALKFDKILGELRESDANSDVFPVTGFILSSSNKQWRVTVDDEGTLITSQVMTTGQPVGLLLSLTYS